LGKRRKGRELLVQALYASRLSKSSVQDCIDDQLERRVASAETAAFVRPLGEYIELNFASIDRTLNRALTNWDPDRIGNVERSIMRMCIAEVSFSDEVPAAVALNEALEVARLFVDDDAVRFINGVLDNALKSIKQEKTD
jgi:transcription antitermination protein NusB